MKVLNFMRQEEVPRSISHIYAQAPYDRTPMTDAIVLLLLASHADLGA